MVPLIGQLYAVSGDKLTHPWDASAYFIAGDHPALIAHFPRFKWMGV